MGLILLPCSLFALDPAKTVFQYNCRSWTREDGLPASGVNAITQTRDGYLWVGTQKGLVRFDGVEFKSLNPPENSQFRGTIISALSSSAKGGVWFGLRNGSFGFHSGAGTFSAPQGESWISPTMNIMAIREVSDGSVWIAMDGGTARWVGGDTSQTHFYAELATSVALCEGSRRRVWIGTFDRGLYYWEAGRLSAFPDSTLANDSITALAEDPLGQLWVGTRMGLRCYDANFRRKDIPEVLAEVKALLVDRNGRLWIGSTGLGLVSFYNGAFTFFQRADGLANENVTALFEDREGSLWIGTRNGLSQLTDVKLPIISAKDGLLGGGSHGVCPSRTGGVWAATTLGISHFDNNTIRNYSTETGLLTRYLKLVYEARDGDLYLVDGNKNILVFSNGKVVASHTTTNWPTAFAEDARGVVVSISDVLFRVSRTELVPHETFQTNPPPTYWVCNLSSCRDGSILIASANGVFRLRDDAIEHWSAQEGLSDNMVLWASEDSNGIVWAGLTTGIARIKGGEVRNITMSNGLYDNFIHAIVPDDCGSLWFNSTRGIFRVSRQSLDDFADGRIGRVECTAYDGIEAVKMVDTTEVEHSGCKTADGRIWFPSPGGLIVVNPTNLAGNSVAPPVHIQQVRVNGSDRVGNMPFAVRPGNGDLEFQYTAATFIAPQKVRFRYILQGYDPAWLDAGGRRSAFYTNLKPGKYRFCVQACNEDGLWNTTGAVIDVLLPPHYYETAWFKLLCGLLAFALLAGLYAWRVRHLHQKQRMLLAANELLESKVRERTRELLDATRRAGMAEVAINVLHSVGNVLNSVNVSASLVEDSIRKCSSSKLDKLTSLLREHERDLAGFLASDETGKRVVTYLETLSQHLHAENAEVLEETMRIKHNVEQINKIVAMQQIHGEVTGVAETVNVRELVEDALRRNALAYEQHAIRVVRDYAEVPTPTSDRHKILQILLNLLKNAEQACEAVAADHRLVSVRIGMSRSGGVRIEVADTGVGIPAENLTRIFSQGFTTHANGHGFSLHSGALAAKELGGTLTAASEGPGKGATFVLELPLAGTSGAGESAADSGR